MHFFDISTSKSGPMCFVHFDLELCFASQQRALFDISSSKSGLRPSVFYTFELEMCFAPRRHSLFRHLIFQEWSETILVFTLSSWKVLRATPACTFSTSHLPKGVRRWCALYILTWNCASRHNSVHFFAISSSKSGLRPSVFYTFELEMCFAPQQRALFDISSSKSGLRPSVIFTLLSWKCALHNNGIHFFDILSSKSGLRPSWFLHFRVGNVLRATTACTFSTSHLPKGVRRWCALYILTWNCASRHNNVHFFDISSSKNGLRPSVFLHFRVGNVLRAATACTFSTSQPQKWSDVGVLCTF